MSVEVRVSVRGSEKQLPAKGLGPQDPGWAAQQNEKEVLLKTEELEVNMLQSVQSPTHLSHTTLWNKVWEVYFSKEVCSFIIIVDYVSACICVYLYMYYGYATKIGRHISLKKFLNPVFNHCKFCFVFFKSTSLMNITFRFFVLLQGKSSIKFTINIIRSEKTRVIF